MSVVEVSIVVLTTRWAGVTAVVVLPIVGVGVVRARWRALGNITIIAGILGSGIVVSAVTQVSSSAVGVLAIMSVENIDRSKNNSTTGNFAEGKLAMANKLFPTSRNWFRASVRTSFPRLSPDSAKFEEDKISRLRSRRTPRKAKTNGGYNSNIAVHSFNRDTIHPVMASVLRATP